MSDRGSILISTANDIGEALVEKLGGEGYAPAAWDKEYNKLGIAEVDSAPALSVLEDSSETGTARGSILLSTANAIGAMLNKKYNTDRGFKPKEWASAASKLAPLPEKSAESASVCSIEDGSDDVPTKSLVVTIHPTLSGVSSVTETQTGRNVRQNVTDYSSVNPVFSQYRNYYAGQATGYPKLEGTFKAGTYTLSFDTSASITASRVGVWAKKKSDQNWYNLSANGDLVTPTSSGYSFCSVSSGHVTGTFKINEDCDALGFGYYQCGTSIPYTNLMLEYGSTAHAYEPYQTPTTYTANLGRTIYGGTADIVNGTGTDENGNDFTFTGQEIPTRLGYNAFWSDQGNTALDYYGEPEPYTRGTASGSIANVQSARTDLPFTKVKANIAPNLTGVSEVKVFNTGAGLVTVPDVSGSITNAYFYNISTGFTLTAGVTYKITMVVNSTVTPFAVSVGVGDDSAYRYDIYNTGIVNKNGVVSFEFTPEASHLTTWDKLWIRAPRYSDPSGSQQTTCTFTVTNILLYTSAPTVYTADLGEPVYGGYAEIVSGTGLKICGKITFNGSENWSAYTTGNGYAIPLTGMERGTWYTSPLALSYPLPKVPNNDNLGVRIGVNNDGIYVVQANTIEGVTDLTSFKAWLAENPLTIIYPLDVTTEFTFDGQVISPREGVNNLWNNAGGDTDVEYFEQE